jgi:vanillate O-demethylase monooxygenase subunit
LARKLCGEPVVLFRDPNGMPHALLDRCWHRLLPLSLGELDSGRIRCMYHGLEFDGNGHCVRIPGVERIPATARVRRFPLLEQAGLVWIWLAAQPPDQERPPDLPWLGRPDFAVCRSQRRVACDFRLLIDNLMDASHLAFVHRDTLADPALLDVVPEVAAVGGTVSVKRWIDDYVPSPFYRRVLGADAPCVRWQHTQFSLPGIVINEGRVARRGEVCRSTPGDAGLGGYFINVLTPETENSCHYFYSYARNWETGDVGLTDSLREQLEHIIGEDVVLVEAQQRAMLETPELRVVNLGVDAGGQRARRLLQAAASGTLGFRF